MRLEELTKQLTEKDKQIEELKDKIEMYKFFYEVNGFKKRGLNNSIQIAEYIDKLEEQIEKMKSDSKTAYIKGIRTMANALKECDRTEGAWTDYFEHTVDKVLKNLLKE